MQSPVLADFYVSAGSSGQMVLTLRVWVACLFVLSAALCIHNHCAGQHNASPEVVAASLARECVLADTQIENTHQRKAGKDPMGVRLSI